MKIKSLLSLSLLASGTTFTMAAFTPVTTIAITDVGASPTTVRTLNSITIGADVYPAVGLATGTTSVDGGPAPTNMASMDDFDLNTVATPFNPTGGNITAVRTVLFKGGNWTKVDTKPLDFFIFEGAGGANPDDVSIAAIFPDDSLGQAVAAPTTINPTGWGQTIGGTPPANLVLTGGQQAGQALAGLGWSITDLKDAAGNALTTSSTIKGIAIVGGFGIDPTGLYAVVAPPAVFYDHLDVVVPGVPPNPVAGSEFDVTITAKDANNATVIDSTLTVTITSPTAGSLMEFDWNDDDVFGDNSGTLVNGVRTIRARNKKAETVTITASQGAVTTTSPPSVTTVAGALNQLQTLAPGETAAPGTGTGKTGTPIGQLQGVPFSVSVRAVDANWNLVSSTDSIGITSTDSLATLPANAPLVAGSASFTVTLNQAVEPYTVTATNLTSSIPSGESAPITTTAFYRWLGATNSWDTSAISWSSPPSVTPVAYPDGTLAVFDDVGAANPIVDVGTVAPSGVIVNSATTNYTFQSAGIGGAATLTKAGASTLSLTVENTYTGDTTVSGGLLKLETELALPGGNADAGTSNLNLSGGVVGLSSDLFRNLGTGVNQVRLTGGNSGFAAFDEFGGVRVVNLTNPLPTPASIALTFGTTNFLPASSDVLVLSHPTATGTLAIDNIIDFGSGGDRTIRVDNGAPIVDAVLRGRFQDSSVSPGNLVKTGTGTLELTATNNNYEGSTQIRNGKLILASGTIYAGVNSARARNVILGSGSDSGVLQLGDESTSKDQTLGSLTVSGSGTANAVVGGNEFTNSVLTINNASGEVVYSGRLGGSGTFENNLDLTKAAAGTLTLSGTNNTYSGTTAITGGTLALGANNVLSDGLVQIGAAILNVGAFSDTVGPVVPTTGSAKVNLNGGTIAFADSSAEDWTGGVLDFTGTFVSGVSVRFGTNDLALSAAQLSQLRINNVAGTYTLSPTGYLLNGSVADPFTTWSGGALFDADTNNDGVDNGLAWLLGADTPTENANALLPVVTQTGGSLKLTFNMLAASARGTAQLTLEHSSDLGIADAWTSVPVPDATGGAAPVTFVVAPGVGGLLNVQATISSSEAAAGKLFGRLKAVK